MKRETDRHVTSFFQKLLELKSPWRVMAVELREEERSVEIEVEWSESYKVPCPECGRACAVYGQAETRQVLTFDRGCLAERRQAAERAVASCVSVRFGSNHGIGAKLATTAD